MERRRFEAYCDAKSTKRAGRALQFWRSTEDRPLVATMVFELQEDGGAVGSHRNQATLHSRVVEMVPTFSKRIQNCLRRYWRSMQWLVTYSSRPARTSYSKYVFKSNQQCFVVSCVGTSIVTAMNEHEIVRIYSRSKSMVNQVTGCVRYRFYVRIR